MKAPMKYVVVTGGKRFRLHHVFPRIQRRMTVLMNERVSHGALSCPLSQVW